MREIDVYIDRVMRHVPPPAPGRHRIEADIRTHLQERIEAGEPAAAAVARMGPAADVAGAYLAEAPAELAGLPSRAVAFLVDWGMGLLAFGVVALGAALLASFASPGGPLDGMLSVRGILPLMIVAGLGGIVLAVLYFPVLEAVYAQTPGKWLLGIYVARDTGAAVGLGRAFVRRLPLFFEFFWLDALFAPFTERKQRAFDIVAGTVVLRSAPSPRTAASAASPPANP